MYFFKLSKSFEDLKDFDTNNELRFSKFNNDIFDLDLVGVGVISFEFFYDFCEFGV